MGTFTLFFLAVALARIQIIVPPTDINVCINKVSCLTLTYAILIYDEY